MDFNLNFDHNDVDQTNVIVKSHRLQKKLHEIKFYYPLIKSVYFIVMTNTRTMHKRENIKQSETNKLLKHATL